MPKCRRSIPPSDLFSFGVGAAVVRDRHLVNPGAGLGETSRELRLDAEAVGSEGKSSHQIHPHRFVTRLHVGEVEVRRHVRQHCQQVVAHAVPVVQHPSRVAPEATAEYGIGAPIQQRLDDAGQLTRIVLEVRVLYDGDVAGGAREGASHGRALPAIPLVNYQVVDGACRQ